MHAAPRGSVPLLCVEPRVTSPLRIKEQSLSKGFRHQRTGLAGSTSNLATPLSPLHLRTLLLIPMSLDAATMKELKATADALSAPGKGFPASGESAGPWLRAGHVEVRHKKASFSRGGHLGSADPFLLSLH